MDVLAALASHPLLANAAPEVVESLRGRVRWHHLPGGRQLMGEGDKPLGVYVVDRGRLRATRVDAEGNAQVLGDILPGEVVGELSILMQRRRTAAVRALRDSRLIFLPTPVVLELFSKAPEVVMSVVRGAVSRAEKRNPQPRQALRTLAVIPAGEGAHLRGFCKDLTTALSAFGKVTHLALRDRGLQGKDPDEEHLVDWLHEQEKHNQFVVFEAEPEICPWTRRCLRQADKILVVGNSRGEESLNAVERWLNSDQAPAGLAERDLVLVHDEPLPFSQTDAWLNHRQIATHFHVRQRNLSDFSRLARLLTGEANALVLSGGGARGLAHIGVLAGLADAGVTVDAIAGTSMGAVIAAWFAEGHTIDAMVELAREFFVRRKPMKEYTLPLVSLVSGHRVDKGLKETFGERRIEDMLLPFVCTSSNLSDAQRVLHDRGVIWRSLRASLAIPGILPPVPFKGDLLVDGGVLNNLPADVLRERYSGRIIASDVGQDRPLRVPENLELLPVGASGIFNRLRHARNPEMPSLIELLYRSAFLGSTRRTYEMQFLADRMIRPLVAHIDTLDFERLDEAVALGREATRLSFSSSE
jgi:predicted acylesterase/phospholipase RssA/CRP-like cAMP-binding protein